MRRTSVGLLSLALATGVGVTIGAPSVGAAPTVAPTFKAADQQPASSDELPNPQETKRRALKDEALQQVISGKITPVKKGKSTVAKLSNDKKPGGSDEYVELGREGTDKIFVILAEFGNERHPDYPDQDTSTAFEGPSTFEGPLHNAIPAPDRSLDNSTNWDSNYSREYFEHLYFGDGGPIGAGQEQETVKQWYERQSSGRYSIDGTVSDWVKVKYNEARYGRSNGYPCTGNVCSNTWNLVQDAANQWYADQLEKGRPKAEVDADLRSYDQWDRYDFDGDGDFNEPDGYIDHFQIVHAGGDQADGDPHQGEDAIWSHRWATFQGQNIGPEGNKRGGNQIGDSGIWIYDYTVQPENGGMSVFTHEYGHDLGLPDLYDSATGQDNGVNWWSMMSQSRQAGPTDQAIGSRGSDFGAWEKYQLGWLDYAVVRPADRPVKTELGPHEYNSAKPQAAIVVLPKKSVTTNLVPPYAGSSSWWSGMGNNFTHTLSRNVTLGAGTATLTFQANWDIEDCGPDPCDYAYVEVKDGAGDWTPVAGTITKSAEGNGIDGKSNGWKPASFDLSAYAGKTVGLRFRYSTDPAAGGKGFFADDVKLVSGTTTVFESGAETGAEGWTADGFSAVGATTQTLANNYYIASHRDYVSFDKYLQSGPYNFGWLNTKPDLVEHFPYQDGLLISYWDTSQTNNNTGSHPGQGLILPVDANPAPVKLADGTFLRARVAGYDAPFSKEKSDSFTYHKDGIGYPMVGADARPLFQDNGQYWFAETPYTGVKIPNNGVNILVESQSGTSMTIKTWLR